jgi:heparan-alpha-glucosaminide N-acetyltransferase
VNKSLYTFSYMLITSASAGIAYSALYLLVSSQKQVYHFYFRNMDSDENIGFALYYR